MKKPPPTITGSFDKGREGSVAVNFGRSAGVLCWDGCRLKHAGCYAEDLERMRPNSALSRKLLRMEKLTPAQICNAARAEILARVSVGYSIPWLRFAVLGSMPWPRDWPGQSIKALRLLLEDCRAFAVPVHLPCESPAKAKWYQSKVGDLCCVRQSIQTNGVRAAGPCAFVAGIDIVGGNAARETINGVRTTRTKAKRLQAARELAARRQEATGRTARVCPEIAWKFTKKTEPSPRVKCGAGGCTWCADADVDVVYPKT